ncbi:MAG: crossover junction endodeoxyribonuclease RuvC [Actinomycetales bacterium]|nr:crossover junction endodeoxyribonuclease RuvC [Actinomycetales bacterium]
MRVLGIDPGLTRCGVAVIDGLPGRPVTAHFVGVITTAADGELADRLTALHAELTGLIDKYSPEVIAIERVFSQQNVRSAMSTAQAAGVGLLLAGQRGIRVGMHTPTEVKAAVTGNGRADKKQVTLMVTKIAQLQAVPKPADAADALAIAITQAWRGSVAAKYEAAKKAMSK